MLEESGKPGHVETRWFWKSLMLVFLFFPLLYHCPFFPVFYSREIEPFLKKRHVSTCIISKNGHLTCLRTCLRTCLNVSHYTWHCENKLLTHCRIEKIMSEKQNPDSRKRQAKHPKTAHVLPNPGSPETPTPITLDTPKPLALNIIPLTTFWYYQGRRRA